MSLINDMLKDLSNKSKSSKNPIYLPNDMMITRHENYVSPTVVVASLLLMLTCIVMAWLWRDMLFNKYLKDRLLTTPPQVAITVPVPVTTAVAPIMPTVDQDHRVVKVYDTMSDADWQGKHYHIAMDYAAKDQWDAAINQLQMILARYPEYHMARESLAAMLIEQHHFNQAQQLLHEGLIIDPEYIPFIKMQAHLLIEENKIPQAVILLAKHNPDIATEKDYYAMLAALYEKLGKIKQSGTLYQALVHLDTTNPTYWLGLAIALEQTNNTLGAKEAYQQALNHEGLKPDLQVYATQHLRLLRG